MAGYGATLARVMVQSEERQSETKRTEDEMVMDRE